MTGEAVVLDLRLAKLASRGLALFLDALVQGFLLLIGVLVLTGLADDLDSALQYAFTLVFVLLILGGYPIASETLSRGRSLGKLAMGLRVVRDDGGPIRFRHAFVRGAVGVVELWLLWLSVALIASLASKRGKRLGDLLAGTVVVHDRVPVQGAPVAMMPAPLAAWAAGLDLSAVPDDLALAARQYLSRAHELAPAIRDSMGGRLASQLAAVTAPPPPPGVPAWAFLAAVVAERRRREIARMQPAAATTGAGAPRRSAPPPEVPAAPARAAEPGAPGEPQPFVPPS